MKKHQFNRLVTLTKGSTFLLGPRMTGKSTLLEGTPAALRFDLLNPQIERELRINSEIFWKAIEAVKDSETVIIDEVQRIPELLDYVQLGIQKKNLRFILSGSSARKLKRGNVNLLGGRASETRIYPLTFEELGGKVAIEEILSYGTLPLISQLLIDKDFDEAKRTLRAYHTLYIREEVQSESLVRNLSAFERFLVIAAQSNGTQIQYANIGRDCLVPDNTVKEYFKILEDTLLGYFLWPYHGSERKKLKPKFYFFDCGVVRAIQNKLNDPPGPREKGNLFETFFINECIRIRDYKEKEHKFSVWRDGDKEVDLLVEDSKGIILAMECKSTPSEFSTKSLKAFRKKFPSVPLIVASLIDTFESIIEDDIRVVPWERALHMYAKLG